MEPQTHPAAAGTVEGSLDLAWFVTPHGLGHAARAAAVMAALSALRADIRHHVFSTVPQAFFAESLPGLAVDFRAVDCDVGLIQTSPFDEDIEETVGALESFDLDDPSTIDRIAAGVARREPRAVVSDIAPLGVLVARRLGIPSVLVENFTWDWIYRAYGHERLDEHARQMAKVFRSAEVVIQTEPVCRRRSGSALVAPISRRARRSRTATRALLGVADDLRVILLSTGVGTTDQMPAPELRIPSGTVIVGPGDVIESSVFAGAEMTVAVEDRYHPDLVAASDLVIGKLGYSTVAEVYHAGTPFAYLRRPRFPESPVLEAFVVEKIPSAPLPRNWYRSAKTNGILERLLAEPRSTEPRPNGADEAAIAILGVLD